MREMTVHEIDRLNFIMEQLWHLHNQLVDEDERDRANEVAIEFLSEAGITPGTPDDMGTDATDTVQSLLALAALRDRRVATALGSALLPSREF